MRHISYFASDNSISASRRCRQKYYELPAGTKTTRHDTCGIIKIKMPRRLLRHLLPLDVMKMKRLLLSRAAFCRFHFRQSTSFLRAKGFQLYLHTLANT